MPPAVRIAEWASARAFVLCLIAALGLALQTTQAIGQSFQFGAFTMVKDRQIANDELLESPVGKDGFTRKFLAAVGGISFEAVAVLPSEHAGSSVCPRYIAGNADGKRLAVEIGADRYSTLIYDWQLIPIVNYADSKFVGIVSLFGPQSDETRYHIVYHPAFRDTLLGLRLLHGDVLLTDLLEFGHLPKVNGSMPLGAGEVDFPFSERTAIEIASVMASFGEMNAWVITDVDRESNIVIKEGRLSVDLEPYFYFWVDGPHVTLIIEKAEDLMNELKLLESGLAVHNSKSTPKRIREIDAELYDLENDYNTAVGVSSYGRMNEAIEEFDTYRDLLTEFNPPVMDALRTTARFAALFRLAKQTDAGCWQDFVAQISGITPLPKVETPNRMPRRN